MQHSTVVQRLQRAGDGPGHPQPVLRRQRPVFGDVLAQGMPLKEFGHDKGAAPGLEVDVAELAHAHQGGMIQVADRGQLPKQDADVAVQGVAPHRAHDHRQPGRGRGRPIDAQEDDAEGPGAEDALGIEASERKRFEGLDIQRHCLAQGGEGFVPVASLQGGSVDIVVSLGPRDRVDHQSSNFLEVVLTGFEVADDDLELSEAVQQSGQTALLVGRQAAEAFDQVLHDLALAIAA